MRKFFVATAVFAMAASALASETTVINSESVNYTNVNSWDALGDADNEVIAAGLTGGFLANELVVTGTLDNSTGDAATWASEASFAINGPNVTAGGFGPGAAYTPPLPVGAALAIPTPFDPASIVSFEFYESFDDTPDSIDQTWTDITLTFRESTTTDGNFGLGTLPADGSVVGNTNFNAAGFLDFYTFDFGGVNGGSDYLNIQTLDALTGDTIDSELAIYDSAGNFIATDDDGQETALGGLYSMLSFGADPLAPGGTDANPGEDGATLAAGTYTIVVGGFNTDFTPNIADIIPGTSAGDYQLDVSYVPEPASLALMLLGFAGLARRR